MTGFTNKFRFLSPCLFLFAVAFLAYANTFANGWTYDDFPVIVENPDVKSWANFLKDSYPGRPLRELTYLIDHALFGLDPTGWRIQQIFWHALNGCLVFALGRQLRMEVWVSLIAGLIFLLHPLQVEVVANLSHRKDSLALAGSLGAILCYFNFLKAEHRRLAWLLLSAGCWIAALYAKQTTVLVPVICIFGEWLLVPPQQRVLTRFPKVLAGLSVAVVGFGAWRFFDNTLLEKLHIGMSNTLAFKANYFEPVTAIVYYMAVLKSWVFMGLRLIWPLDLALEYTFAIPDGFFDPWVLVGLVLLLAIFMLFVFAFRRWPTHFWLLSSAILLFLPTANLWPLTYLAADRYLYAPLAFLALFVAMLLPSKTRPGKAALSVATVVIVLLAILTWQQNRVWESPKTLWAQAIKVNPTSSFALNNMGNLALLDGDNKNAQAYYQRSVDVNAINPTGHYNLGMLAENRRDLRTALAHYRAFAELNHPAFRKPLEALRVRLMRQYGIKL